jgi:DNA (cytosine-5)-methyltransferase 1
MNALSLFSGCGGLDIAAEMAGITVVGQCEIDPHCNKVLAHWWPNVTRWEDVHDITADSIRERIGDVELIFGGFPCQPHSVAGKRKGSRDDRDLWPEIVRLLREARPRWFVGENVPGLLSNEAGRFFGGVLRDLASLGYDASWGVWGACDVDAPHRRERVFIVAHRDGGRRPQCVRQGNGICGAMGEWRENTNPYAEIADSGISRMADAKSVGRFARWSELPGQRREAEFDGSSVSGDVADANNAGPQVAGHEPGQQEVYEGNRTEHSGSNVGDAARQQDRRLFQSGVSPDAGARGELGDAERGGQHRKSWRGTGQELADGCARDGRIAESVLGGTSHGIPYRSHFPGWPAGRGEKQKPWEPPRVAEGESVSSRAERIKMLGNAVVPAQAAILFEAIMELERRVAG